MGSAGETSPTAARPAPSPVAAPAGGWWRATVLPVLISAALRLLFWTLRVRIVDERGDYGRWLRGEQVIVAFWHGRLIMMPLMARGGRVCILNSQHRDGELATRVAARWGVRSVRGSATRGGVSGFLQLVRMFRDGYTLAVAPDGPRGPRERAKPGVVHLARVTGTPIVPVSWEASRCVRLRSWDRMAIPTPFARVAFVFGEAVPVRGDAAADEVERQRALLEERLNDLSRVAGERLAS